MHSTAVKQTLPKILLQILATGLLYFALGKLCLIWAVPPGFSTILWLPAGIAILSVLSFGNWALSGVLIGSFCVNYLNPEVQPGSLSAFAAFTIACGGVLQAYLSSILINRYVSLPTCLRSDFAICKFYLLAGPISCIINPLFSCTSLYVLGVLSNAALPSNIITWWIGDSLGAMALSPFIFVIKVSSPSIRWRRFKILFWPVTTCFALTLLIFYNTRASEKEALNNSLRPQLETIISSFEKNLVRYKDLLEFSKMQFSRNNLPTRTEFQDFAARSFERYPGLIGLSWIPIIPHRQRATWEKTAKDEGFTNFEFQESIAKSNRHTAPERETYKIIFYNANPFGNTTAIGFNLFSEANRLQAMETADQTSTVSSTPLIQLIVVKESELGSVMYLAIKQGEMNHPLLADNGQPVMAYVSLVLRTNDVIKGAIGDLLSNDFDLTISEDKPGENLTIFTWGKSHPDRIRNDIVRQVSGITQEPWIFSFALTDSYIRDHASYLPWYFLIAGMLVTCGVLGFMLTMTGRNEAIKEEIIERRTAEAQLAKSNLELKQRELELDAAKTAAEDANRSKSAFLANMSHEIRTPLSAVLGFSELLSLTNASNAKALYRETIKRNGKLLTTIINDILDISTIEAGKLSIEIVETNLKELVADVDAILRPEANRKLLILEMTGDADLPTTISTDPDRLRQILINIIGNAIKFTSKGAVIVRIKLTGLAKDMLNISVDDSGAGINPEKSNMLFRPFAQLDEALNRQYGGTGLGLALSRWLARYLGGDVFLEKSELGKGSRFIIQINPKIKQEGVKSQIVNFRSERTNLN